MTRKRDTMTDQARHPRHVHGEAFKLMTYRSDDGTEGEVIWNSRDGVTPFVITLRSGKPATHVNWASDAYAPDHKPAPGDRIFVDVTRERAKEMAQRNAKDWWDHNIAGARDAYASVEEMAGVLEPDYFQPGAPDLIEVAAQVPAAAAAVIAEMGAHDMIVSQGDCQMFATCACGKPLGTMRPNQSMDVLGVEWERHVVTETTDYPGGL